MIKDWVSLEGHQNQLTRLTNRWVEQERELQQQLDQAQAEVAALIALSIEVLKDRRWITPLALECEPYSRLRTVIEQPATAGKALLKRLHQCESAFCKVHQPDSTQEACPCCVAVNQSRRGGKEIVY